MAKKITDSLKGWINVRSQINVGTTFNCYIKIDEQRESSDFSFLGEDEENLNFGESVYEQIKVPTFDRIKKTHFSSNISDNEEVTAISILIVDDDAFNQYALSQLLQCFEGVETFQAYTGKDAIDMVARRYQVDSSEFDIIIMDINMPVMDGIAATLRLRDMARLRQIDLSHTNIYMHSAI